MTPADQIIAAAANLAAEHADEARLCAAAACDWARENGDDVVRACAMAGPFEAAQRRETRRELRRRESSLRKAMLDARGVPLWARILSWVAPPPWGLVITVVTTLVPWLIQRWTADPYEMLRLDH